ncbi:hypothetical protein NDU88_000934 [Pleurodeles waltl]|uniref:Uncharacterized protein n=1 Tax=Pleurodeles waltl TaxID=8319 RepID=A0AAV7M1M6_PLEWA|nr:hypothetical protein NDU88_000934 [Pleurodeles waltl]
MRDKKGAAQQHERPSHVSPCLLSGYSDPRAANGVPRNRVPITSGRPRRSGTGLPHSRGIHSTPAGPRSPPGHRVPRHGSRISNSLDAGAASAPTSFAASRTHRSEVVAAPSAGAVHAHASLAWASARNHICSTTIYCLKCGVTMQESGPLESWGVQRREAPAVW